MEKYFIDFHCHTTLKPFSQSFSSQNTQGKNTVENVKRSIWFKTKITNFKKALNAIITLTKFTQTDFTSAYKGGAKVIMVSIDPMERELILNKKRKDLEKQVD